MNGVMQMVVDVHRVIMSMLRGFAAQAKIHTRNNVGQLTGKIYFGSKQGYPEKGEKRTDYPGGYVLTYDPKTGQTENFGMPQKHFGIISVTPDEQRGLAYISTCDDGRPIEHSHFMVLDLKTKKYRDLGDTEHSYAFIVLDDQGRAYHPLRGGKIARYDPAADKLEKLAVTVDGAAAPTAITKDGAILNWDASPDGKTLWCVEMSTNQLFSFDLTANADTIPGKTHGPLLNNVRATDCRAMCADLKGKVWMGVTEHGRPGGPQCTSRQLHARREDAARSRAGRHRQSRLHQADRRDRQAEAVASHAAQGEGRHPRAVAAARHRGVGGWHGEYSDAGAVHADPLFAGAIEVSQVFVCCSQ